MLNEDFERLTREYLRDQFLDSRELVVWRRPWWQLPEDGCNRDGWAAPLFLLGQGCVERSYLRAPWGAGELGGMIWGMIKPAPVGMVQDQIKGASGTFPRGWRWPWGSSCSDGWSSGSFHCRGRDGPAWPPLWGAVGVCADVQRCCRARRSLGIPVEEAFGGGPSLRPVGADPLASLRHGRLLGGLSQLMGQRSRNSGFPCRSLPTLGWPVPGG